MSDIQETVTVEGDFITVSLVIWRRFRRPMPGLAEQVYDLNQNLAEVGPYLPVGTVFQLPVPIQRGTTVLEPIKLW